MTAPSSLGGTPQVVDLTAVDLTAVDLTAVGLTVPAAPAPSTTDPEPDRASLVAQLFREHSASLTRLAGMLTSDRGAAEEVVQDAFVGLHRRFGEIRDGERAVAYLRTSVVNGSRSKLRRRRTERNHIPPYLPPAASAEEGALAAAEREQVRRGLQKLPRRQREVLVLRYHLDLTEADIAGTLGISRGAVKAYASRALTALGAHLEEQR